MDGRESLDRSSAEAARTMPGPDGRPPYHANESFESDRGQQGPVATSANGNSGAADSVLQSDVYRASVLLTMDQSLMDFR